MMITAFTLPIGLIVYGWSAQYHTIWVVPDIGAFFLAAGVMASFLPVQSYLVRFLETLSSSYLHAHKEF